MLFKVYRLVISPAIHTLAGPGAGCRHEPSCSRYAEKAIADNGWARGSWLALKRLSTCHPWGKI